MKEFEIKEKNYKGKEKTYKGIYKEKGSVVIVYWIKGQKGTQIGGGTAESLAKQLLREMINDPRYENHD